MINPKFVVTLDEARKAFDEYELKGEKKQKLTFGETHSLEVTAQGQFKSELLTLSVEFLSPLDQARKFGYQLGLRINDTTPADRKAFEDRVVGLVSNGSGTAAFTVRLLPVPDSDSVNVPLISFELQNQAGLGISPTKQPSDYTVPFKDIIAQVALAENGQELTFSVNGGAKPQITDKMEKMTLVIDIDGKRSQLDYRLKN